MANVTFKRPEYAAAATWRWPVVRDICAGSETIKGRREAYLPVPNATDQSPENAARYEAYLARAVFYNATGRTRDGLIGAAFRKVPTLTVPALLEYVGQDIDGAGLSIYQQSQLVLGNLLEVGRHGLLVDYPRTEGDTSRADQVAGRVRPTVKSYAAESIINWRYSRVGADYLLSLLVLAEVHEVEDGFGIEQQDQFRVLRLQDGIYTQEVWRKPAQGDWQLVDGPFLPLDAAGRPWSVIPFAFVGAQSNDANVDESPLYDIAELNLGHYRNSADYEDAAFLMGQPQVWLAGLDEHWVELLKTEGIYFGSRAPLPLPVNGAAGLLQAGANTMIKEAMDAKERQMVALGARLVEKGSAVRTVAQEQNENAVEHSVLTLCVSNVSEAYTQCLEWMAQFAGATGETVYAINQEFVESTLSPQMLAELVKSWQAGAITDADLWTQFRRMGLVPTDKSDEAIREELSSSGAGLNLDGPNGDGTATH